MVRAMGSLGVRRRLPPEYIAQHEPVGLRWALDWTCSERTLADRRGSAGGDSRRIAGQAVLNVAAEAILARL